MTTHTIRVADRETGVESDLHVEAPDRAAAERRAIDEGYLVVQAAPAAPAASASPAPAASHMDLPDAIGAQPAPPNESTLALRRLIDLLDRFDRRQHEITLSRETIRRLSRGIGMQVFLALLAFSIVGPVVFAIVWGLVAAGINDLAGP